MLFKKLSNNVENTVDSIFTVRIIPLPMITHSHKYSLDSEFCFGSAASLHAPFSIVMGLLVCVDIMPSRRQQSENWLNERLIGRSSPCK